ncbi:hypothetical protein FIA58_011665 [Flavobacterium jejuense]|uniref:Uncharacterized protein n=1 Tax=Flavobacterium jejuense TaxID=1544455 RepID=A0ABX0IU54_9FLAO|nr:hypothetical protein [Flavobacterium jejuense]NHN26337.1 hypothetical protein [Flavobacterium jejuense]
MKKIEDFQKEKLNADLTIITGGRNDPKNTSTTWVTGVCDIHHDTNGNDQIDPGECVDIVKCEE